MKKHEIDLLYNDFNFLIIKCKKVIKRVITFSITTYKKILSFNHKRKRDTLMERQRVREMENRRERREREREEPPNDNIHDSVGIKSNRFPSQAVNIKPKISAKEWMLWMRRRYIYSAIHSRLEFYASRRMGFLDMKPKNKCSALPVMDVYH